MINLAPLFDKQDALDTHIAAEHPPQEGEDRLGKLILALNVELGECANCWRGFKFWSHDQSARTSGLHGDVPYNPLLEEYVDVLHFILSIGNHTGYAKAWMATDKQWEELHFNGLKRGTFVEQFNYVFSNVSDYAFSLLERDYCLLVVSFLGLGEMLGFTDEQIAEAYEAKNRENHARQERGY